MTVREGPREARVTADDLRRFVDGWTGDRIVPDALRRRPRTLRRARLVLFTSTTVATLLGVAVLLRLRLGPIDAGALVLAGACLAVLAAMPWILRATGSLQLAAQATTVVVLVLLVTQVTWAGGVDAPAAVLLVLIPLLVVHLVGVRTGRWAILVVVGTVVILTALAVAGIGLPSHPLDERGRTLARGLMVLVAVVLVWLLSRSYEHERRALQQHLQQSQALYRRLFTQSKDVVALSTPTGELIDVNRAGVELYGFDSKETMLAADTRTFYDDPAERAELVARLAEDGYVSNYETHQRTVDGRSITVQGTTTGVRDDDGAVSHFLTILRDVTAERQAAAELERKNAELERFTAVVSHDLKNPMFTIRGFLELARTALETDDVDQALDDIGHVESAIEKMQAMVDDLLRLSLLGASELDWGRRDLTEIAREVEELLTGPLQGSGVELVIADDLPQVFGDRTLLRTMLQNLIENAIKFLDGQDSARIEVGRRSGGEGDIVVVRDNGPGIASEDRERIFQLFTQLDPEASGTGIGLATVRKVVEIHQGRIWVESERGGGACFCLDFPPSERRDSP